MKKSYVTRELVNLFPTWTRVRNDEQSVGYQTLNAIAQPMEYMEKSLSKMRSNTYLTTVNLDEIDVTHKVSLPVSFTFDTDTSDPAFVVPLPPTVSGFIDSEWVDVTAATNNDIESFWYSSTPDRITLDDTVSGETHNILAQDSSEFPASGEWDHHLGGGTIWAEVASGVQYLQFENANLYRAQLLIHGETRKGTIETETLVFPWDMRIPSKKEWKKITKFELTNFEDSVGVVIDSANYNISEYLSPWNFRYSETGNKIDEFWGLGISEGAVTLDLVEYISDEWQQLVLGFVDKQTKESWELLDADMNRIEPVDMALQPFTDNAWVVTESGGLYCYDTEQEMVSGVELLQGKTPGANVQVEMDFKAITLGEDIEFLPWHARPLAEIRKYRIWYQTPSGTKYGLLNGVQVSFSSDFWIVGQQLLSRTVEGLISITSTERGEYLIVFETEYINGVTQNDRTICKVNYKQPIASFDLTTVVSGIFLGIDFDSDQKLWVRTSDKYYQIGLHTDTMLVDYTNKELYFKEDYDSVEVLTNG